jgi:hypothetical protein
MNESDDSTAAKGVRDWWLSAPRSGTHLLINPMEYRHLRAFGAMRVFGGSSAAGAGLICLSYDVDGWAAFFLTIGALNIAGGCWYLTIDRSGPSPS